MRVAFLNTELSRDGPGLLLRDLQRGKAKDIDHVLTAIENADPQVLVLQGIDWDLDGRALDALGAALAERGLALPHRFATKPNLGVPSGLDLNDNGRLGDAQDAIGFGRFTGQGGLAVLSRYPIDADAVVDFTSTFLWSDLPKALLPYPGMPEKLPASLPLSSAAHWLVPIRVNGQEHIWLGIFAATTPVFDGPEDRNGRRNHDEVRFWSLLLDGLIPNTQAPEGLVIAGNANLDPEAGDGRRDAIRTLLNHPALQDPAPRGDLGTGTVDFGAQSAGVLRVSYLLPDRTWRVLRSGQTHSGQMRHRLIWLDLIRE